MQSSEELHLRGTGGDGGGSSTGGAFADQKFETSVLASLASLQHTCNILTEAVETLDLKLSELLDVCLEGDGPLSSAMLSGSSGKKLVPAAPPPVSGPSVLRPGEYVKPSGKFSVFGKDEDRQRGSRLLFSALKQILYTIPSQYEHVDTVYDEIKAFVAANLLVTPDITPTNIVTDNLMPYLRTAHGLDPSLRDLIWKHMSGVTGCMAADTRRTLKRMIDNHYRGFKRKPASSNQIPASMIPLLDVLRANAKHDGRATVDPDGQRASKRIRM